MQQPLRGRDFNVVDVATALWLAMAVALTAVTTVKWYNVDGGSGSGGGGGGIYVSMSSNCGAVDGNVGYGKTVQQWFWQLAVVVADAECDYRISECPKTHFYFICLIHNTDLSLDVIICCARVWANKFAFHRS